MLQFYKNTCISVKIMHLHIIAISCCNFKIYKHINMPGANGQVRRFT